MKTLFTSLCLALACAAYGQCPQLFTFTGTTTMCAGENATLTLSDSEIGVSYQLEEWEPFPGVWDEVGSPVPGTGEAMTWTENSGGKYRIYAVLGGCNRVMTGTPQITVNPIPSPTLISTTNTCANNATISLEYTASDVRYDLLRNGMVYDSKMGADGPMNFTGVYSGGTFTVKGVYPSTGCWQMMDGTVFLNSQPSVYIISSPATTICHGGQSVIDLDGSQVGVTYQVREVDFWGNTSAVGDPVAGTGNPLQITFAPAEEGPYIVRATTSAGCPRDMSGEVSFTTIPSGTVFSLTSPATCANNAVLTLSGSESDKTYTLRTASSTINSRMGTGGALTWTVNTSGTFYVEVLNHTTGCKRKMAGQVTLNPAPVAYDLAASCVSSQGRLTLSGSQSGFSYQLRSFGSPVGAAVNGTGAALTWDVNPTSNQSYSVLATNPANGCTRVMTNTITFPAYNTYNVSANKTCANSATVSLSGSDPGVTYRLYMDGNPTGSTVNGTGGVISWGGLSSAATYTVYAQHPIINCSRMMNGNATLLPYPASQQVTGNTTICQGTSATITVQGSQSGMTYQLRKWGFFGYENEGSPINGTGGSLQFTVSPEGDARYMVRANNPAASGCSRDLTDEIEIDVTPVSLLYTVSTSSVCLNSATVTLSGSNSGVDYILSVGSSSFSQPGSGNALTWSNIPVAGAYRVDAHPFNGCPDRQMTGTGVLYAQPSLSLSPAGTAKVCANTPMALTATTDAASPLYAWSTGQTTSSINVNAEGTYRVTVTDAVSGCTRTDSTVVTLVSGIGNGSISMSGNVCTTGTATLTAGSSSSNYNFKWSTGQTTRSIQVTQPGYYWVTYKYSFVSYSACRRINPCVPVARMATGSATDVPEIEEENVLSVFPNPADDKITVTLSVPAEKPEPLTLFDITGSVVHMDMFQKSEQVKEISIRDLSAGLYYVSVYDMGRTWYVKVVVQH